MIRCVRLTSNPTNELEMTSIMKEYDEVIFGLGAGFIYTNYDQFRNVCRILVYEWNRFIFLFR